MTKTTSLIKHLQLEQLMQTIPSGLFLVDRNKRVISWNRTAEMITGFSAKEALGQECSFLKGIPCGGVCGLFDSKIPKPIIGGRCTIVTKSGETRHLIKNIEYLRDEQGEVVGGIESFTDITNQYQLEQSLRDQAEQLESRAQKRAEELAISEARFRAVLDTMDDLAYIVSADHLVVFTNRAMTKHFGDIIGRPCHKALHDLDEICSWCPMARIRNNRTVREERRLGPKNRMFDIIHSPLRAEDGSLQKLSVCRDITETKQAEMELREANRELDAFTHSVSHDLRGILAPVVTYMDFLRMQYDAVLEPQVLQILAEVERQSERAIALLDDLLDLAQVGHVSLGSQMTKVDRVVQEVINEIVTLNQRKQHSFTVKDLPESWIPDTLIYQVFVNLINNACNYVDPESGPIEIGSWREAKNQVFYVRDHGNGITPAERDTVFDIFYRGKGSTGTRGTGVGLAIVRKIALRCHGSTWVEDTPGGGATFCFSVPVQPVQSFKSAVPS